MQFFLHGTGVEEGWEMGLKQGCFTHPWLVFFFFAPPGNVMAPPNKLFSPILSTCIGTSVLLLLLLLFLLYKYNQVRFPVAQQGLQGLPSLGGHPPSAGSPRQGAFSSEVPAKLPPSSPQPPDFPLTHQTLVTKPNQTPNQVLPHW